MKVPGYKLNGYDATYEKTTFEVFRDHSAVGESGVLEVMEINSGITFVLEMDDEKPTKPGGNFSPKSSSK